MIVFSWNIQGAWPGAPKERGVTMTDTDREFIT